MSLTLKCIIFFIIILIYIIKYMTHYQEELGRFWLYKITILIILLLLLLYYMLYIIY